MSASASAKSGKMGRNPFEKKRTEVREPEVLRRLDPEPRVGREAGESIAAVPAQHSLLTRGTAFTVLLAIKFLGLTNGYFSK